MSAERASNLDVEDAPPDPQTLESWRLTVVLDRIVVTATAGQAAAVAAVQGEALVGREVTRAYIHTRSASDSLGPEGEYTISICLRCTLVVSVCAALKVLLRTLKVLLPVSFCTAHKHRSAPLS